MMGALLADRIWTDMFALALPALEKVLRPLLVYIFLIVGLRLAGKRELAQINTFDLVVLLMLSNTVQNAIIGDDNSITGGLLGAATLLATNYLVVRFLFRRAKLDRFLEGSPVLLIRHGEILHKNLDRELITIAELEAAAHKQGFRGLQHVEQCVLETGGSLAFIGKDPSPLQTHHDDIIRRLDEINRRLDRILPRHVQE